MVRQRHNTHDILKNNIFKAVSQMDFIYEIIFIWLTAFFCLGI